MLNPSRRTASSLLTDCESEPYGLRASISRTKRETFMSHLRVFDETNANIQ